MSERPSPVEQPGGAGDGHDRDRRRIGVVPADQPELAVVGREAGITFVALAVFALFSLEARYFSPSAISSRWPVSAPSRRSSASGWTYLLITAELDLSVGPMYSFMQIACAWLMTSAVLDPWIAFFCTLALGAGLARSTE